MTLTALLLVALPASATVVQAEYCVDWNVDYDDAATGDFYTGTDGPARGVKIEFSATGTSTVSYYTDWTGSDPGCITINIDDQYSWTVKVVADAYVNGNYVRVLTGIGGNPTKFTVITGHTPQQAHTYSRDVGPGPVANIMGVASYALYRHNAGLSAESFNFVNQECNTPGEAGDDALFSCWRPDLDEIRIADLGVGDENFKFVITHEMGHAVAEFANEDQGQDQDYEANGGDCGPSYDDGEHAMPTKEFSSATAVEGIAHFWSAVALNDDGTNANCDVEKHYKPDWDHDQVANDPDDVDIFTCSGAIVVNQVTVVGEYDYYGQYCDGSGAQTNRSTEYDWLRALWDARTQGSLTVANLFDIWHEASPDDWTMNGMGSGGNFPAARMSSGAYTVGGTTMQSTWDTWAALNGIDR